MNTMREWLEEQTSSAKLDVLATGDWMTAPEIQNRLGNITQAMLDDWESNSRVFAIEYRGEVLYPLFGFDPACGLHPYPVLRDLILAFRNEYDPSWALAFWLSSANGYLTNSALPKDVLGEQADCLLFAAEASLSGILHG